MKKLFSIVAVAATIVLASCGGGTTKQVVANTNNGPAWGDTDAMPAAEYDTDESFGATGIASGPVARMDVIQMQSLTNAQNLVRQKMKHAYKGAIDDYSSYIGNNAGSDATTKMERAGTQIIDAIVNDTKATQIRWTRPDDKGNIMCFTGIRVDKKLITDAIADYVSEDEELKIRFKEEEFRKKMDSYIEKYKANK